jgi:hypothetical protein
MAADFRTCEGAAVRTVVCCDVCKTPLRLTKSFVVAAAEVITFAEAHGEHAQWALAIRTDATCQCRPAERAAAARR